MIIQTDTVWRAGETHVLTDTVQIADGATLTIEGGATVSGGAIQAYGHLNIQGSASQRVILNNVAVNFGINNYNNPGHIDISYASFDGGSVLFPTGQASYGYLDLNNSIFNRVSGFYIWYPSGNTSIVGNVFVDSQGLSVGSNGAIDISHNIFTAPSYTINGTASVVAWANYGPQANVNFNSFIGSKPAIEVTIDGKAAGQNNWFGSEDGAVIETKIIDRSDDLSRKDFIEHDTFLKASDLAAFSGVVMGTIQSEKLAAVGSQYVYGGGGDDVLSAVVGHPVLDGGNGSDTVTFSGVRSGYVVQYDAASHTGSVQSVTGDLSARLVSIEALKFADGIISYDAHSSGGQVYALYSGLLGRAPDSTALDNFANSIDKGTSLGAITSSILASSEAQQHINAVDNANFVEQVYETVLGRSGDAAGAASWINALNAGTSRVDVVDSFVFSPEHINNLQPALQNGIFVSNPDAADVARLYYAVLERAPDAAGHNAFLSAVSEGVSLHDVSSTLLSSSEYRGTSTGITDNQFVDAMYGLVLSRSGDSAGEQSWNAALAQGTSRSAVVDGFTDSFEFQSKYAGQSSTSYVEALYEHVLGRQGDAAGLQDWSAGLDAHSLTRTDVARAFTASAEFQNKYVAPVDTVFVDNLYQNALGRHADASGLASWTAALADGTSRADVALGIAGSTESHQHLASQIENGWHLT